MDEAKLFLKNCWRSWIFMGESMLWFSGAVGCLGMAGMFIFALAESVWPSYTKADWFFAVLIICVVIPFLLTVVVGYIRGKLGYPSIANASDFVFLDIHGISGLVWLMNIMGFAFVLALAGLVIQLFELVR